MIFDKNVFVISAIFIFYFAEHVSALNKEAIMSGFPVPFTGFEYQTSIVGVQNGSNEYTLLGGGTIISDTHILSVANIFLLPNGELKKRRFSAVVGTNDISVPFVMKRDISHIFFTSFDPTFIYFNIAVVELIGGVGLGNNPFVSSLTIPNRYQSLNTEPYVSGFGYFQILTHPHPQFGTPITTYGDISPVLRFRKVNIISDEECMLNYYPRNITITNICGKMQRETDAERIVGVCTGDHGCPLVIGNMLIGIVSIITFDCDNTQVPALYMKVSIFKEEIDNFLQGIVSENGFIRYNRLHIPRLVGYSDVI